MFFAVRRRVGELAESDGAAATEEFARAVAARFNTSMTDVIGFARRIAKKDMSLNAACGEDGAETWIDRLPDEAPTPEEAVSLTHDLSLRLKALAAALRNLPPRERHIIRCRFLSEPAPSRADLGAQLGLSKERVRQLELRALTRLRGLLQPVY
jgi:RNA polymerase sigma-32 factor